MRRDEPGEAEVAQPKLMDCRKFHALMTNTPEVFFSIVREPTEGCISRRH